VTFVRWQRGAAIPETALALTAMLGLTFGIIQLGVLGYLQLMSDGAAFIAVHEYSLGDTTGYSSYVSAAFPSVASNYVDQKGPATAPVTVNYEAGSAREGGVTLLRPNADEITIHAKSPAGGSLGTGVVGLAGVDVHGSAIEPEIDMSNRFYDVDGLGYTGAGAPTTFFGSRLDTPYYYVSQHRLTTCTFAGYQGSPTATCPSQYLQLRSLGTAEFLDRDNWSRGGWGYFSKGQPFQEMICHQNKFTAAATADFPAVASTAAFSALYTTVNSDLASGTLKTIYSWDQAFGYNTAGSASATWGQDALNPLSGC
jgi:hypothetical protein